MRRAPAARDGSGSSRMSATQATTSVCRRPTTRSSSHFGVHHGARVSSAAVTAASIRRQPPMRLGEPEVDQRPVCVLGDDVVEQPAGHLAQRLLSEPWQQLASRSGQRPRRPSHSRAPLAPARRLVDDPDAVVLRPTATPPTRRLTSARGHPRSNDVLGEEVVGDEVLKASRQRVLAGRDDRRVRDRQAERCRNNAVTANQSAIAPTIAASEVAWTYAQAPSPCSVATKTAAATRRRASATARIRRSPRRRATSAADSTNTGPLTRRLYPAHGRNLGRQVGHHDTKNEPGEP